jgi:DNA invertase Pin-like site-specific DNA recombinase
MRSEGNGLIFLCLVMVKDAVLIFRLDRFHRSMASNPDMVKAITPKLHHEPGMA